MKGLQMNTKMLTVASLLSLSLLAACGKEESKAPESNSSGSGSTPAKALESAKSTAADASAKDAAATATPTADAAAATANDLVAKAKPLIEQATTYIKDHKMDLAEKAVTELEGMKPKLPTDWASKVDQLRSTLNAAKAAQGLGIKIGG